MKKMFFIIGCLLSIQIIAQDVFYVTMAEGNISRQNRNKIKVGDKLLRNEKVIFTTKKDFLIVLNPGGRYVISVGNKKITRASELINLLVKDNIQLHAGNVRLSSRAVGEEISMSDYFKPVTSDGKMISDKILITDELRIPFKNMGYTNVDDKENFFFLQLIDSNNNGVNKKLKVSNENLLLNREDFIFNGKLYTTSAGVLKLGFVEGYSKEKKITEIADIKPVYVTTAALKEIVRAIKRSLPNSPKFEIMNEIYTQLYYLYGKPGNQLINDLYDGLK